MTARGKANLVFRNVHDYKVSDIPGVRGTIIRPTVLVFQYVF